MYMHVMCMHMYVHAPKYVHAVSKLLIKATIIEPYPLKAAWLWLAKVSYVTYHFRGIWSDWELEIKGRHSINQNY